MASNKRVLSTSTSDSTSSLEPLAQRMRISDREGPAVSAEGPSATHHLPEYQPPYRSWEKLQDLKTGAFSSFTNPRNHENAWHAPYSDLFHELTRPYRSLATHIQYRLWRLSSERSRTTFHRRFPPLAPPPLPDLEADYAASEPDSEPGEDTGFGDEEDDDDDSGDDKIDRNDDAVARLKEAVNAFLKGDDENAAPALHFHKDADDVDLLDLDFREDDGPETVGEVSAPVNRREGLFLSTSTVPDRDNRDQVPDIVIVHQETETLSEIDEQLEPIPRLVDKIYRQHRCGRRTVHQCIGLIGEFKRNIPRQKEMKTWGGDKWTDEQKQVKIEAQINRRIKAAKLDLAHYCQVYFKNFLLIQEVVAFAAVGPYWQYAVVERGDVDSYLPDEKRWRKDNDFQTIYLGKFSPCKEIGTEESDEALTEMRDLHLHLLAHDDYF
ncbi:hypothetical protein D9757_011612 [Collybiopsis confluens]|uniref:Uncharacterized protein n=1 Tax=Collybiopsis confluens TaxID=2823264 RepID=A0A8H5GWR2_9AGAR|nr:hypothetical protein D9757_011612 [Collybiopsis confluens]